MTQRQDQINERERCIAAVKKYVDEDTRVYTLTTYGKGTTDYVRVFVAHDGTVVDITYYVARAADYHRQIKPIGWPFGGAQYSKGLEAFDWTCRVAGTKSDQRKWGEL